MKSMRQAFFVPVILALFFLGACQGRGGRMEPVTIDEIAAHIRYLSDDRLEGRGLGSEGLELAARYHEDFFRALGLEPAFGESYRQVFPLRGARIDPAASLEFLTPEVRIIPVLNDGFLLNSEREDSPAEVSGELVYCGYLIQAPERKWDDLKGANLEEKVLLVEINEPGNYPGGSFDGEDLTYYGRWTCKFEKAAELGAAGILIIHNSKGAGYNWEVLRNSWSTQGFFLPDKNPRLHFQGWISGDTADRIVRSVRKDRKDLLALAESPEFAPVPLGLSVRVRQRPAYKTVEGVNVAGIIRARNARARNRMIVISAHYDHFGRDTRLQGDQIYNGAVDNCSASASMLGLAAYYAQNPRNLKDDLCFVAVTAEETGMLGSDFFARHLPFPKETVAANINFEMTNVWGETEDVYAIGAKHSELDGVCRSAAESLGLRYTPERNGSLGFFFRSDQLSFARAGIPGVWLHQGIVSRGAEKGYIQRKFEEYQRTRYHKVTDEIEPDWDIRGALQIIRWAEEIISIISKSEGLPQFIPDSSFRRID